MSFLGELKKHVWVILLAICYIVINMVLTYYKGIFYFNLLPLIVGIIFITIIRLDYLFFLIIICTPLSIPFIDFVSNSPIDFAIPTEPLLFGIMLIVIFKIVHEHEFDIRIIKHPLSLVILLNLLWIFITAATSTMPLVSFKFFLARVWFLFTYYLLAIYIFRKTSNIKAYVLAYGIPMIIVISYTISRHLTFGLFDREAAHFVMTPFFRDHTSYGAVAAMLFFATGSLFFLQNKRPVHYLIIFMVFAFATSALILSYTRAAWLSVILSFGILGAVIFHIKFKYVLIIVLLGGTYYGLNKTELVHKMEKNKQASSAEISEHVKSISNIKSDKSNIERLNRWSCAYRMFLEKPVFGWGPGTYMFQYAPFQLNKYKTSISTDFGNKGNAHSEYLGPLCEQGFLGSISFIFIAIFSMITGFKVYYKITDKNIRVIVLGMILGLFTYFVHGIMNNFLDTDKISALFWGFMAVFVSLDIYNQPDQKEETLAKEE